MMKSILHLATCAVLLASLLGCDDGDGALPITTATTASAPVETKIGVSREPREELFAHFRIRWWVETNGWRIHEDGRIDILKEYHKTTPVVFDVFVQPGPDRLEVAQDNAGRRMAIHFQDLRLVEDYVEAKVVGLAANFPLHGAGGAHFRATGLLAQDRTIPDPYPTIFHVGKPVEAGLAHMGIGGDSSKPGPEYGVFDSAKYDVELVATGTLAELMQEQAALANTVPDLAATIHRDLFPPPATQPH